MRRVYRTRQSEAICDYIASLGESHVTAAQVVEHFTQCSVPIGRTTVYRQLEKLAASGKLRKYNIDGITGACYQFMEKQCAAHLHLKCEGCGELLHLQCDTLHEIQRHISDKHDFLVNETKTVLYGKCGSCALGKK